jgi:hypothetical protein
MTKTTLTALIWLSCFSQLDYAQNLPSESPKCKITQQVGLGYITVHYSRPAVKGRKIFGGLIPYDQVWRTGANLPTFIVLTDTAFIANKKNKLKPGKYALYTIPGLKEWTIIFSKDTALWGAFGYNQKNDALRFNVIVSNSENLTENFTIGFDKLTDNCATIRLQWENTLALIPICFDIEQRVLNHIKQSIAEQAEPDWSIYWAGAKYLLNNKIEFDLALQWINKSVEIKEWSTNMWTKAQIHAARGEYSAAVQAGQRAIQIGTTKENIIYFPYQTTYEAEMKVWAKKK